MLSPFKKLQCQVMRTKTQHKNDNSAEGDVKVGDTEMKVKYLV